MSDFRVGNNVYVKFAVRNNEEIKRFPAFGACITRKVR